MKYKYPAVEIVWDDAESDPAWTEIPTSQLKATLAVTIGFLVAESAEYYLVADTYIQEPLSRTISCTTKIPKGWVKEFHIVNITRKRKSNGTQAKVIVEEVSK